MLRLREAVRKVEGMRNSFILSLVMCLATGMLFVFSASMMVIAVVLVGAVATSELRVRQIKNQHDALANEGILGGQCRHREMSD